MKKLLNYISVLGIALAFTACENDLEKVTYNVESTKAAVLATPATTSYVLESRYSENTAFTLEWTAPDFGYDAIVTTTIDFDLAGNDFANAIQLASVSTATSQEITIGTLNANILTLLRTYGIEEDFSARDFEIRLSSSISEAANPLLSNVLTLNITPYSADIQYPEVYAVGDYSGWGWDTAQSLFSFSEDAVNFEGIIDFGENKGKGFKLTGDTNWDNGNWGLDGSAAAPEAEAPSIQLINDGGSGNIACYSHRYYRFQFNNSTLLLTNNLSFDALFLVGSASGLTWDTSKPENEMQFDPERQRFYIDYTFAANDEIKFLTDNGIWFGGTSDGGLNTQDNIKIATAGSYRIYVNLNNSSNMTYELNAEDYGAE